MYKQKTFDQALYDQIDFYYNLDQDIRTEGIVFIDGKEVSEITKVDEYIEERVRYQFKTSSLSELDIGVTGTYKLWIILLHVLTHVDNELFEFYDATLKKWLCQGTINPQYYASIIDRRRQYGEQIDLLYYEFNIHKYTSDD